MNPLRLSASVPIRSSVGVPASVGLAAQLLPTTIMGRPHDEPTWRMAPMKSPRHRAWRAMLSALAGGGLTAASLGGPLGAGALGATVPAATTTSPEGSSTSVGAGAGAQQAPATEPSNTTSTTPSAPPSVRAKPRVAAPAGAVTPTPTVVLQRRQKTTASDAPATTKAKPTAGKRTTPSTGSAKHAAAPGPNNVALPPELAAGEAGALAAALASSAASAQALAFYRIPLFLLPVYEAAAAQYGVPWQILAAINEIETNYGTDQSVSTAGAVGWMQFMPATWLQYGVDAVDAGYADPYNPVDAIFAAARYLRAAGAATDLRAAILAYNHSEEYVDSVLLRAKLISTYPKPVVATLTGLVDDRPPVTGKTITWGSPLPAAPSSPSSATANAVPTTPPTAKPSTAASPSAPPSPAAAAAAATGKPAAGAPALELVELLSDPNAAVVAVQDGQIVRLGSSRQLGKYVILRDVYGDVFTYAGLGSIAPSYRLAKGSHVLVNGPLTDAASARESTPSQPATAGHQPPLTLHVKTALPRQAPASSTVGGSVAAGESAPAGMGKVRLFAHPGNPDARAAAAAAGMDRLTARRSVSTGRLPLLRGSVVAEGTVLGHVSVPPGARDGHLRFAIRPAGDTLTIDPRPILSNWVELYSALHPQGAKGASSLLGATVSEVLLMSKSQLERAVLSDPGILMPACSRREVAAGAIDRRALAVLAFLSRSGLKPTVTLRCGGHQYAASGYVSVHHIGDAVAITQINGIAIAGHQGPGSITDTTIRTLLTLHGEFVPRQIVSLMQYRDAASTLARPDHGAYIELTFSPSASKGATAPNAAAGKGTAAHSAGSGPTAPSPFVASGELSAAEWDKLITRIAALPVPIVSIKPSASAIPDPKRRP
jgi:soluble lytic murein transglycosylase-like protein